MVSKQELTAWRDVDDLLDALGRVAREDVPAVSSELVPLLDHPDADVREEAARVLFVRGKFRPARARAVGLLQTDPEIAVRCTAAFGVAATSTDQTLLHDTQLLLSLLRDSAEDDELRKAVYESLLIIHRRKAFPSMTAKFSPTADVDWSWISTL